MIIPSKVKISVSLENTSEMSLETTQRASSFDAQKLLRLYTKRNEPSSAKIRKMKQHRARLTGGKQFYRAFLPRFNTCVSCLCSKPTE